jgi:hypothetical protein
MQFSKAERMPAAKGKLSANPSPRGKFLTEGICVHTLPGINFLLGLIKGCQKLSIFHVPVRIEAHSAGDQAGLESVPLRSRQPLNRRFNFLNRTHLFSLERRSRPEQLNNSAFLARAPGRDGAVAFRPAKAVEFKKYQNARLRRLVTVMVGREPQHPWSADCASVGS